MTPAERFLAAIRHEIPDRVPVAPDISNYIPCKRTGLRFWDIYFHEKIPLWRAYLDAMDYFGGEAWIASCLGAPLRYDYGDVEQVCTDRYDNQMDAMIRSTRIRTPDGDLTRQDTCFRADPPSPTEKPIKDLRRDFPRFRWLTRPPTGIDRAQMAQVRQECDRRKQAFGVFVGYPGFHMWMVHVENALEQLAYAQCDSPEILEEWLERDLEAGEKAMQLVLECRPDYILLGGSGTITLASPELARKYALPAIARFSRMAHQAGVSVMLHSCGRSRVLVDMLAAETEVDLINPLEIPPMGDVDLAEVKRSRGRQIGLMGNLHTTEVMLRGKPELVRRKAIEAMRAAGPGGGFILSTGDQCGRETPEANLFALIETARAFGQYDRATGHLPSLDEYCSCENTTLADGAGQTGDLP